MIPKLEKFLERGNIITPLQLGVPAAEVVGHFWREFERGPNNEPIERP